MDIRNTRAMKDFAAERLSGAPQEKKIVLIYSGIVMGLALLSALVQYVLGLQIDRMGGLSQMGTRTVLSTVQSMLPLLQSLVFICLELGYVAAMLRIARGQYASPNTLRLGFDRFWTLMRCCVIRGLMYLALAVLGVYVASMLFIASPWSEPFLAVVESVTGSSTLLNPQVVVDDAMLMQVAPTMLPMFLLSAVTVGLLLIPVMYRFRMVGYVIIDKPALGAMAALRESKKMMRGKCMKLLKLDFSYWWYYLALFVISFVANLDQLFALLGIEIPMSADFAYFFFYIAYLLLQLAAYTTLRNRVEVTYSLFYDSVKPEEPRDNGVVLGNIFNM